MDGERLTMRKVRADGRARCRMFATLLWSPALIIAVRSDSENDDEAVGASKPKASAPTAARKRGSRGGGWIKGGEGRSIKGRGGEGKGRGGEGRGRRECSRKGGGGTRGRGKEPKKG